MIDQKQAFDNFIEALLQHKFHGTPSEEDVIAMALALRRTDNVYAKAAIDKLAEQFSPEKIRGSAFWSKAELMGAIDIASVPRPTPSRQDQHGLWNTDSIRMPPRKS